MIEILIGGDLVPTQSNIHLFENMDINSLLGRELLQVWNEADFRIFNLEVPLTDNKDPISKCGPNLIAPTCTINGIKALNPSLITLANNHILDQGIQGLKSTKTMLNQIGIPYVGIGDSIYEASIPYILKNDGVSIGIYACAEHEFSIATENSPGANPFDPLESLDHIAALKEKCDYVIVFYHGGKEHYRYPSPYLQKVCRKMAQKGADLVVCQHSHCIGCHEEYLGSALIYGQGNFVFDESDNEFWQTSLFVRVMIGEQRNIEFIPIVKAENSVRLAHGNEADDILQAFYERSSEILQNDFIERQYQKFALENYLFYIRKLSGFGKWLSRLDVRLLNGFLSKRRYSKQQLLAIENYIECEAHRELLLTGLRMRDDI